MDHLRYLCLVFVMILRLFFAALWSPAGKVQTSWLLFAIEFINLKVSVGILIVLFNLKG